MSLYVETLGQGPNLVLLHGWGMHGGVWEPVAAELAQSFRLHIVDLPGLGNSAPVTPYELATLTETVAQAMPEKTAVCGWSFGGQIAMQWALSRPEQVERLILAGSTPRFVSGSDWDCGIAPEVFQQFAAQVRDEYRNTLSRFLALQAYGGDAAKDTIRQLRERFFERGEPQPGVLQSGLDILLGTDMRDEVGNLRMPTLVLHGDYDKLAPVGAAHWLGAHLPHASVRICERASHAPFLSHPSWFIAAMKDFLHD